MGDTAANRTRKNMAVVVALTHPTTGLTKRGLYGFSWTTLLFGPFPAFFRSDWLPGIGILAAALCTSGLSSIIIAFFYNKYYTTKLVERGYELSDTEDNNARARIALGIVKK